jgi:hypothetical protein
MQARARTSSASAWGNFKEKNMTASEMIKIMFILLFSVAYKCRTYRICGLFRLVHASMYACDHISLITANDRDLVNMITHLDHTHKSITCVHMCSRELANFSVRIEDYVIHAELETDLPQWHFPRRYTYFYNSVVIFFFDKLSVLR